MLTRSHRTPLAHSLGTSLPPDALSQDNLSLLGKKTPILRPMECAPQNRGHVQSLEFNQTRESFTITRPAG